MHALLVLFALHSGQASAAQPVNDRTVRVEVEFPPETPPGESVKVLLAAFTGDDDEIEVFRGRSLVPDTVEETLEQIDGLRGRRRPVAVKPLSASGVVEFACPEKHAKGLVFLSGPHLYLDRAVPVDLMRPPERIHLTPSLGGRLVVAVRGEASDPAARRVSAWLQREKGLPGGAVQWRGFEGDVGENDIAFDALLPGRYRLFVLSSGLAPVLGEEVKVSAGTQELVLEPGNGASVRGRVTDWNGNGVEGVRVAVEGYFAKGWVHDRYECDPYEVCETVTGSGGDYVVAGVPPGAAVVHADAPGGTRVSSAVIEVEDHARVDLRLRHGETLSGTVRTPEGVPAAGAHVRAIPASQWFNPHGQTDGLVAGTLADETGAFALHGLPREALSIWATLGERCGGMLGIRPGAEDLELVLAEPLELVGRVVDDTGSPVTLFDVRVYEATRTPAWVEKRWKWQHFEGPAGVFRIAGLYPGDWGVVVDAPGHHQGLSSAQVALPQVEPSCTVTVTRTARVSGVVLDQDGREVPRAEVSVMLRATLIVSYGVGKGATDRAGRFDIEGVEPGFVEISPSLGSSKGEEVQLKLAPGEHRGGIELRFRR